MSPRGGDFAGAKYIAEADELLVELAQIDVTEVTVEKYVEVQQTAPINEAVVEATKDESVQSAIKELTVHITCLSLLELLIIHSEHNGHHLRQCYVN